MFNLAKEPKLANELCLQGVTGFPDKGAQSNNNKKHTSKVTLSPIRVNSIFLYNSHGH